MQAEPTTVSPTLDQELEGSLVSCMHRRDGKLCDDCRRQVYADGMTALWHQAIQTTIEEFDGRVPVLAIYDGRFFHARDDKRVTCVHGQLARYGGVCVECQAMVWWLGGRL